MKRRSPSRLTAGLLALIMPASVAVPAAAAYGGAQLHGEDLPTAIRLSILTQYLIARIEDDLEGARSVVQRAGLDLEPSSLRMLSELYGDFDAELQARLETELRGLEDHPEVRREVSREVTLDREAHTGRTLGRWLSLLRQEGYAVEGLLSRLLDDPTRSMSLGSTGSLTLSELELRAERFAEGFEQEYGTRLATVLAKGKGEGR